ncbi:MAG TPA: CBS domain-containing protein [Tepidisphaeraceae bacterium]|nr:CBS domain-containing protein [Tepidisphaeraceae bacterium]
MPDVTPPSKGQDLRDNAGQLGEGGDTRRGEIGSRGPRKPDPDTRPTEMPADITNVVRPGAPGTRISDPGEGVVGPDANIGGPTHRPADAKAAAPCGIPHVPPIPEQAAIEMGLQDAIKNGINRVEDDLSIGSPRLSVPSDRVGPENGRTGLPELQDPNFTAASQSRGASRDGKTAPDAGGAGDEPVNRRDPSSIGDLMTADVECCTPQTELNYVARMMADHNVGAIPVVEHTGAMKPVGIVTDRDIVVRVIAKNQDPYSLNASACMSTDPLTVTPETGIEDCLRQMEDRKVRRVLVVDGSGRCIGIVAQADIVLNVPRQTAAELVKEVSQPG